LRQISTPQILFKAAETILRRVRAHLDTKISRAALGGQHFRGGYQKASRVPPAFESVD